MPEGRLYIGNRRYSSWSLRGWLAVRLAGIDVEVVVIPMRGPGGTPAIQQTSPSGLVPYLEHDGMQIWESLAICEYAAERNHTLWPTGRAARTHARVISAEMHAGFRALRQAMPMVLGRDASGQGRTPEALADIARIETLWRTTRATFGQAGPYLFGATLTAADAMFAPVVCRFITWAPDLAPETHAYVTAIRAHPLMEEWYEAAAAEPLEWRLPHYEGATPT